MTTPEFAVVGGVILDDIVYPDGRTRMGVLGGGGTHVVAGMNVWDVRPGLLGTVGEGVPEEIAGRLEHMADLRGVVRLNLPQIRGWQIFEWDGRRTEIFRVDVVEPFLKRPLAAEATPDYDNIRALYVLRDAAGLLAYRERYPAARIFWEPEQAFMAAENRDAFVAALPTAEVVSPNLREASLLYGESDPHWLLQRMLDDGARVAALRLGEAGSLVGARGAGDFLHIPAVPVPNVVDVTGAGNTYGGAFFAGWHITGDLAQAAAYGAVAASFCIEQLGALAYTPDMDAERARRFEWAMRELST